MEVHPPEHGIHTWRDFLVHMGTIVLGLLIAISLEQSVEALHHRHQRQELRESLQSDNKKILRDNNDVEQEALSNLGGWPDHGVAGSPIMGSRVGRWPDHGVPRS